MSRAMTAAQVIGLGEYLNPDFDPATLTVSQLLGILGYHNIRSPTPYTKPKLVQLFLDEIKPKAAKFRRTSRKISRAPSDDDEPPPRQDPPKRRRSSAQPSLGAHRTTVRAAAQPAVSEESEPEMELPVRKVGRSKKNSQSAPSQRADVSGREDNHVFQSGPLVEHMVGSDQSNRLRPAPPLQHSRSYFVTLIYLIAILAGSYSLSYLPSVISDSGYFKDRIPCRTSRCAPCPEFASCTGHSVVCNPGYLLRPHPVLSIMSPFGAAIPLVESIWSSVGNMTNGLPRWESVFPPRCIEDPKRKRNIGALGKAIEALLGQERGMRICTGVKQGRGMVSDSEGGEAKKWGLEVETLRESMKRKTAPHLLATFDDTFNEALQQLVQWGGVIIGEDHAGKRYLAHKTPHLTWNCQLTVKSRELWEEWRGSVYALIGCMAAFYYIKRTRAQRRIEGRRVAELVQIALDTLRNQELAHHTDPVTAPHPYLPSLQLRDLILQDEHSISVRRRVWNQVERVVEGNANVRANLEEVQGGDELRVWRWVGTAGGADLRKKVQFETRKDDSEVKKA